MNLIRITICMMFLFGCTTNNTFVAAPLPVPKLLSQCQADKQELENLSSGAALSSEDFARREILLLKLGHTIQQKKIKTPIFKNFAVPDRYETVPNPNFNPRTGCRGG